MWRLQGAREAAMPVDAGTCLTAPAEPISGFAASDHAPLAIFAVAMPPGPAATRGLKRKARGRPIGTAKPRGCGHYRSAARAVMLGINAAGKMEGRTFGLLRTSSAVMKSVTSKRTRPMARTAIAPVVLDPSAAPARTQR